MGNEKTEKDNYFGFYDCKIYRYHEQSVQVGSFCRGTFKHPVYGDTEGLFKLTDKNTDYVEVLYSNEFDGTFFRGIPKKLFSEINVLVSVNGDEAQEYERAKADWENSPKEKEPIQETKKVDEATSLSHFGFSCEGAFLKDTKVGDWCGGTFKDNGKVKNCIFKLTYKEHPRVLALIFEGETEYGFDAIEKSLFTIVTSPVTVGDVLLEKYEMCCYAKFYGVKYTPAEGTVIEETTVAADPFPKKEFYTLPYPVGTDVYYVDGAEKAIYKCVITHYSIDADGMKMWLRFANGKERTGHLKPEAFINRKIISDNIADLEL